MSDQKNPTKGKKIKLRFHKRLVSPGGNVFEEGEVYELTEEQARAARLEPRHKSHCTVESGELPEPEDQ